MDPAKYRYQSEFARKYFGQGKAEGMAEGEVKGKAELVLRQLTLRYGALSENMRARVQAADAAQLDRIAERVLSAATIEEALSAL